MVTQTNKFQYYSDSDDEEITSNHNISCSLFYTPLIGGVAVYTCMWLFNKISDFHLFDAHIE
jgi:replication initiation and membrane attachment protein DnaB